MKIGFILGSEKISGGSYVILQHSKYLLSQGHHVDFITLNPVVLDPDRIWHKTLSEVRFIEIVKADEDYDLIIATWWLSPFHLYRITSKQYAYFVQSIEAYFFDDSRIKSQFMAHSTYGMGLPVITEATWIQEYLESKYNSPVLLVKNGIEKSYFNVDGPIIGKPKKGIIRCLIEGPLESAYKNTVKTIEAVKNSDVDEVWLLTSSDIKEFPNVDRVFSQVPISSVGEIYRSCDFIVKQSTIEGMFGPPLEMFHCGGTAIVSKVTGYDEYIVDGYNALCNDINDFEKTIININKLCSDRSFMEKLKHNAKKTAEKWPSWKEQSIQFERALFTIMQLPKIDKKELEIKSKHILNLANVIDNSLQKHYTANANVDMVVPLKNDISKFYRESVENPIEPPSRISYEIARNNKNKKIIFEDKTTPRILGISISNEHIEELWHPIINKLGADYKYISSRPKGYFRLYSKDKDILDIPDERYIIDLWWKEPSLLYQIIESYCPDVLLLHSGTHPAYQKILYEIQKKYDLPIIFSELGWFPQRGNIYFDRIGTNFASSIAKKDFMTLTGEELKPSTVKPNQNKCVLIALQLENDMNMVYASPHFNSNFEFISTIIDAIPENYQILIKPHPLDHNAHIYDEFNNDKVKIVDGDIKKLLLSVHSVFAINSTVLLEAMEYSVNIYKGGLSILDNKGIAISFTPDTLKDIWTDDFIDNMENRRILINTLTDYQCDILNVKNINFKKNKSIQVLMEAIEEKHERTSIFIDIDSHQEMHDIPKGKRVLTKSINEILKEVSKYDIISFDVFDTLLIRNTLSPKDIFEKVQTYVFSITGNGKFDFISKRIEAEQGVRKNLVKGDVTIDEIYKNFLMLTGLPAHIVNQIKQKEIMIETESLFARKSAKKIFDFALAERKKVIILSDFYMSRGFVKTVLMRSGFNLDNVELFVSCDIGMSKKHGDLYNFIREQHVGKKILHIGDNFNVDLTMAIEKGIDSLHFPNLVTCLHNSKDLNALLHFVEENHLGNLLPEKSLIYSLIAKELFDDPFKTYRSTVINEKLSNFGTIFLGPLLFSFTDWVCKNTIDSDKIVFLARDGYLMKDAYDRVSTKQNSIYLFASRRMMNIINISFGFENIQEIVESRFSTNSIRHFLEIRLDLKQVDIDENALLRAGFQSINDKISLPKDKIRVLKLLQGLKPDIIQKSEKMKNRYVEYLQNVGVLGLSVVKISLVDIGYFGSMQKVLHNILKEYEQKLDGYYIADRSENKFDTVLSGKTNGFVSHLFSPKNKQDSPLLRNLIFMEQFFSAPHASIIDIKKEEDGSFSPIYLASTGEEEQWEQLNEIHRAAINYVDCAVSVKGSFSFDFNKLKHDLLINAFFEKHVMELQGLLNSFVLENRYNGDSILLLKDLATSRFSCAADSSKPTVPKDPAVTKKQPVDLFKKGLFQQSINAFYEAIEKEGDKPRLRRELAEVFYSVGNKGEALKQLELAQKKISKNKNLKRRILKMKYGKLAFWIKDTPFI